MVNSVVIRYFFVNYELFIFMILFGFGFLVALVCLVIASCLRFLVLSAICFGSLWLLVAISFGCLVLFWW